jgi:hypothetical protein
MADERFVFVVEWHDVAASLFRTYNLIYYINDNNIEMVYIPYIYHLMILIIYTV